MTFLKNILIPLCIVLLLTNCERDDICSEVTPTTPRLIIQFYDITEADELKFVPNLTVYGDSPNIPIPDNNDNSGAILIEPFETSRLFNLTVTEAKPPLVVGTEGETITTRFAFERRTDLRLDDDASTNSNIDYVDITYVSQYVYVSRACGYKSVFSELRISVVEDDDNWIINTSYPNNPNTDNITVENEAATHINIFH